MKKVINFAKEFSPSIIALVLPAMAFAQNLQPVQPPSAVNVPQGNIQSVNGILQSLCTVFSYMFYFLIVLSVIFVIVAAFKYLTAAGDPEKVKSAGTMLIYTAVAIGVALLARAIPLVVGSFLGAGNVSSC
jgi:membrane-associated phospholipid phosphatase